MSYSQQHVVAEGETPASSSYFNAEMTYVYNSLNAEAAAIAAHIADTADAHDASAISVLDTAEKITGTNVETALAEIALGLETHLADTSDAHDASAISVLDTADKFTGTNVETVLAELADASTINITDTGELITATDVEGALAELATDIAANPVIAHAGYDATEYTKTGDTSFTEVKEFAFTPSVATVGYIVFSAQLKGSSTGVCTVQVSLDGAAPVSMTSSSETYETKFSTNPYGAFLTAAEHTVSFTLKVGNSSYTAYVKDLRFSYVGVNPA